MNLWLRANSTFLVASSLVLGCGTWSFADDAEHAHQLSLMDLAKYRAALTGKPTADDAKSSDTPIRVSFDDLWNRPDALRGRRVTIQGRVERIFRQGPVGSFPALAEIWIASPTGNPYCLVAPQESGPGISPVNDHDLEGSATPQRISKLGQTVRFTGTFLRMIRYAAGDGDRLAPLVVGEQPPIPAPESAKVNRASSFSVDHLEGRWAASPASWLLALALALLTAGMVARRHLLAPMRRSPGRRVDCTGSDPLLEFIDPSNDPS
jgi:hypothetical protein